MTLICFPDGLITLRISGTSSLFITNDFIENVISINVVEHDALLGLYRKRISRNCNTPKSQYFIENNRIIEGSNKTHVQISNKSTFACNYFLIESRATCIEASLLIYLLFKRYHALCLVSHVKKRLALKRAKNGFNAENNIVRIQQKDVNAEISPQIKTY